MTSPYKSVFSLGKELRRLAIQSGKVRIGSDGWSIVMTRPGFPISPMWMLSGKRSDRKAWAHSNVTHLTAIAEAAGAPSMAPDEPIAGTLFWIWPPTTEEIESLKMAQTPINNSPDRNDPCTCGSGKKYKKCCVGKPLQTNYNFGPCEECGQPAYGAHACNFCDKRYAHCHEHRERVKVPMKGHALRNHPEQLPDKLIQALINDTASMAAIRREAALAPELWKKLLNFLATHEGGTSFS